jgi:chromosomal replication initiator protein
VTEATARRFELSVADLKSHSRRRTVVAARDVAMLLARRVGGSTLQEIGRYFGGRDHTTVLHSCRKLEAALVHDSELRTTFDEIRRAVCC